MDMSNKIGIAGIVVALAVGVATIVAQCKSVGDDGDKIETNINGSQNEVKVNKIEQVNVGNKVD